MRKCRPAVPVWIMPITRVLETLPPDADKFDLLIVDESSQCQLFALSLFLQGGFQTLQTRDHEAKTYGPVNETVVDHRMEQQAILDEETRWLDEEKGILCMPIDDAVELFVANNATDAAH